MKERSTKKEKAAMRPVKMKESNPLFKALPFVRRSSSAINRGKPDVGPSRKSKAEKGSTEMHGKPSKSVKKAAHAKSPDPKARPFTTKTNAKQSKCVSTSSNTSATSSSISPPSLPKSLPALLDRKKLPENSLLDEELTLITSATTKKHSIQFWGNDIFQPTFQSGFQGVFDMVQSTVNASLCTLPDQKQMITEENASSSAATESSETTNFKDTPSPESVPEGGLTLGRSVSLPVKSSQHQDLGKITLKDSKKSPLADSYKLKHAASAREFTSQEKQAKAAGSSSKRTSKSKFKKTVLDSVIPEDEEDEELIERRDEKGTCTHSRTNNKKVAHREGFRKFLKPEGEGAPSSFLSTTTKSGVGCIPPIKTKVSAEEVREFTSLVRDLTMDSESRDKSGHGTARVVRVMSSASQKSSTQKKQATVVRAFQPAGTTKTGWNSTKNRASV